jgi:hypothetical protein
MKKDEVVGAPSKYKELEMQFRAANIKGRDRLEDFRRGWNDGAPTG